MSVLESDVMKHGSVVGDSNFGLLRTKTFLYYKYSVDSPLQSQTRRSGNIHGGSKNRRLHLLKGVSIIFWKRWVVVLSKRKAPYKYVLLKPLYVFFSLIHTGRCSTGGYNMKTWSSTLERIENRVFSVTENWGHCSCNPHLSNQKGAKTVSKRC